MIEDELRHQVYQANRPINEVYFPLSSIFSMAALAEEHVRVEVSTIGAEGMVGLPLYLGVRTSPNAAYCQVPGPAACLSAADFCQALTVMDGALTRELSRFTQATMAHRLQDQGLIQYRRGVVALIDRAGLERLACPCYQLVNAELERVAGPSD